MSLPEPLRTCSGDPQARQRCLTPASGVLFCYGYVGTVAEPAPTLTCEHLSSDPPVPILLPSCRLHRGGIVAWAHELWGEVADGMWVDLDAVEPLMRALAASGEVTATTAPDWTLAVGLPATA